MFKIHEDQLQESHAMLEERKRRTDRFIINQLELTPKANKQVLSFIGNFLYHGAPGISLYDSSETLRHTFSSGYCLYFAVMLREAFQRGQICHAYPFGHIVWLDEDNIPYDVEGVHMSEVTEYKSISALGDGISNYRHID